MNILRTAKLFAVNFLVTALILSGCVSTPVIYPHTEDHIGILRVTEIMFLKNGKELPEIYRQALRDSGISDDDILLGYIGVGRVYCCGGDNETDNIIMVFVPHDMGVEVGDIVEVKMGKASENNFPGMVNMATKIREKIAGNEPPRIGYAGDRSNRPCRWVPEKPHLWMRILYCDWMEEEGWIEYKWLWKTWMKPQ